MAILKEVVIFMGFYLAFMLGFLSLLVLIAEACQLQL